MKKLNLGLVHQSIIQGARTNQPIRVIEDVLSVRTVPDKELLPRHLVLCLIQNIIVRSTASEHVVLGVRYLCRNMFSYTSLTIRRNTSR